MHSRFEEGAAGNVSRRARSQIHNVYSGSLLHCGIDKRFIFIDYNRLVGVLGFHCLGKGLARVIARTARCLRYNRSVLPRCREERGSPHHTSSVGRDQGAAGQVLRCRGDRQEEDQQNCNPLDVTCLLLKLGLAANCLGYGDAV